MRDSQPATNVHTPPYQHPLRILAPPLCNRHEVPFPLPRQRPPHSASVPYLSRRPPPCRVPIGVPRGLLPAGTLLGPPHPRSPRARYHQGHRRPSIRPFQHALPLCIARFTITRIHYILRHRRLGHQVGARCPATVPQSLGRDALDAAEEHHASEARRRQPPRAQAPPSARTTNRARCAASRDVLGAHGRANGELPTRAAAGSQREPCRPPHALAFCSYPYAPLGSCMSPVSVSCDASGRCIPRPREDVSLAPPAVPPSGGAVILLIYGRRVMVSSPTTSLLMAAKYALVGVDSVVGGRDPILLHVLRSPSAVPYMTSDINLDQMSKEKAVAWNGLDGWISLREA